MPLSCIEEAIVFDEGVSKKLLVNNPNLKPNKPVEVSIPFATMRLGVWGRKRRPVSEESGVKLNESTEETLDMFAEGLRRKAGELKAVFNYVYEEAKAMGLDFMAGTAMACVKETANHDRSVKWLARESEEKFAKWEQEGISNEERLDRILHEDREPLGGSVFPVEDRWALEWDEIDEYKETAKRIREDPVDWTPASHEHDLEILNGGLLDHLKGLASTQLDGG